MKNLDTRPTYARYILQKIWKYKIRRIFLKTTYFTMSPKSNDGLANIATSVAQPLNTSYQTHHHRVVWGAARGTLHKAGKWFQNTLLGWGVARSYRQRSCDELLVVGGGLRVLGIRRHDEALEMWHPHLGWETLQVLTMEFVVRSKRHIDVPVPCWAPWRSRWRLLDSVDPHDRFRLSRVSSWEENPPRHFWSILS